MFLKLFSIVVVFFLVIFSIVAGTILLTALMTFVLPGHGAFVFSVGLSVRQLQLALLGVALVAVAVFFFRHRRRD
jgi:LPXTG-motif cell wall-anchored protein